MDPPPQEPLSFEELFSQWLEPVKPTDDSGEEYPVDPQLVLALGQNIIYAPNIWGTMYSGSDESTLPQTPGDVSLIEPEEAESSPSVSGPGNIMVPDLQATNPDDDVSRVEAAAESSSISTPGDDQTLVRNFNYNNFESADYLIPGLSSGLIIKNFPK